MTSPKTTASIVVFCTRLQDLQLLLTALTRDDSIAAWILVDNGYSLDIEGSNHLCDAVKMAGGRYLPSANIGFGAGHNLGLAELADIRSEFHVFVNPDISFDATVMNELELVMSLHPDVALVMPRVVFPDGRPQYLCKLLPTPLDLALRRFAPRRLKALLRSRLDRYEMRGIEDIVCDQVPFLSGCFMFARRSMLESVGGFDDRFFLYMEDVDLCRRLREKGKLLYWPGVRVVHECHRGAYRDMKLMVIFIHSVIRYFNKWGWLIDKERLRANKSALDCLPVRGSGDRKGY